MKFNALKIIFLLFCLILSNTTTFAQDTPKDIVVYDIIYLKDGSILKGEILKFNNWDGIVLFKDLHGNETTFQPEDYDHFDQDRRYRIKGDDSLMLHLRHNEGYEIRAGLSFGYFHFNQSFTADNYYLENHHYYKGDQPIMLKVILGEYKSRQHFMGVTLEIGTYKKTQGLYSFGARYEYQYDKYRSNFAAYLPVELKYQRSRIEQRYTVADSALLFTEETSPGNLQAVVKLGMVGLELGHGFSWILTRKNAINLEIMGFANTTLSSRYSVLPVVALPQDKFFFYGAKVNFIYSF